MLECYVFFKVYIRIRKSKSLYASASNITFQSNCVDLGFLLFLFLTKQNNNTPNSLCLCGSCFVMSYPNFLTLPCFSNIVR